MPTIEFQGDDSAAIEYIRKRGYVSYSSMKNVRDCVVPSFFTTPAFEFGKELHSRDLEKKKIKTLSKEEEQMLKDILLVLAKDKVVQRLKSGAKFEQEFKQLLYGIMVLGYIDIDGVLDISDYKTCAHDNLKRFIASMDFLQASLYLKVRKKRDFYYVGIPKVPPHKLMIFNVRQYPERLEESDYELRCLLTYIKGKLKGSIHKSFTFASWMNA
jgi:hypothetical protein